VECNPDTAHRIAVRCASLTVFQAPASAIADRSPESIATDSVFLVPDEDRVIETAPALRNSLLGACCHGRTQDGDAVSGSDCVQRGHIARISHRALG
jgi:hypothetical protein